jgi:hypothetical protein
MYTWQNFTSFAINSIKTKAENRCTITIQLAIYKVVALVTQENELALPPPQDRLSGVLIAKLSCNNMV